MADGLIKAIVAIIRCLGKDDATDRAANLESIFCSLVEEGFALRKKIDNLAVIHQRNSDELMLFKMKLKKWNKFIKENINQETGTVVRRRSVIEELKKELISLEEGFRKLAQAVDDEAAKASSNEKQAIITEGIFIFAFIASLLTVNTTAIVMASLGLATATYYTMYGDDVCKTEIDKLSKDLHRWRMKLTKEIAKLDEIRWKDKLSHPEN